MSNVQTSFQSSAISKVLKFFIFISKNIVSSSHDLNEVELGVLGYM